MSIGRRKFLATVAVIGGGGALGAVALERASTWIKRSSIVQLAELLGDSVSVKELGTEYLTRYPDEAHEGALLALLSAELGAFWPFADSQRLAQRFHEQRRSDFEQGRIVRFGGWMLSRTELRLCALTAITSQAAGSRAVGVFASVVLPGGERVRWTAPSAAFDVPSTVSRLDLPLWSGAPFPQRVTLVLDGEKVDELLLEPGPGWHRFHYRLPDRRPSRHFRLKLHVTPAWTPENDFRTIGIGIGPTPWME